MRFHYRSLAMVGCSVNFKINCPDPDVQSA